MIEEVKKYLESVKTSQDVYDIKVKYLGKKGILTEKFKNLKEAVDKKKEASILNALKSDISNLIESKEKEISRLELEKKLEKEKIDITMPGVSLPLKGLHPINKIEEALSDYFLKEGYIVTKGKEICDINNNFNYLNVPLDHPSRASSDTFYLEHDENYLLRTQTSSVQVEFMKKMNGEEFKMVSLGKVYRKDEDDATHSHEFHQMEALVVGKNVNLSHLKYTLESFAKNFLSDKAEVRLRPSYFPFTEPSYEVDVTCFNCNGKGCSICKNTGFIELLGAGMVHPSVLEAGGYNPSIYSGFAFGIGIERLAILKYNIPDIRYFYINDLRFINEFNKIKED